jgi:hypothetical protein
LVIWQDMLQNLKNKHKENLALKIEEELLDAKKQDMNCDQIFALFLIHVGFLSSSELQRELIFFVCLYRAVLNKTHKGADSHSNLNLVNAA